MYHEPRLCGEEPEYQKVEYRMNKKVKIKDRPAFEIIKEGRKIQDVYGSFKWQTTIPFNFTGDFFFTMYKRGEDEEGEPTYEKFKKRYFKFADEGRMLVGTDHPRCYEVWCDDKFDDISKKLEGEWNYLYHQPKNCAPDPAIKTIQYQKINSQGTQYILKK